MEHLGEEMVICNSCNTMETEDDCKKSRNVISTTSANGSKIRFNVQPSLIITTFEGTVSKKFKLLAKSMLKANVKVLYSLADNKIITTERADE